MVTVILLMIIGTASSVRGESGPGHDRSSGDSTERFFLRLGLGTFELILDDPILGSGHDLFGGYLAVGAMLNDFVGAELRLGAGTEDTSTIVIPDPLGFFAPFSLDITLGLDSFLSALVRVRTSSRRGFRLIGLVGMTRISTSLSTSLPGFTGGVSSADSSFSVGAGIEYELGEAWSIEAEYLRYYESGPLSLDGLTAGVGYRF